MNLENLNYLKDSLKYLGFGEKLNSDLQKLISSGKKEFTIGSSNLYELPNSIKGDGTSKDFVTYELSFKQGKNDMYFFNSYKAQLHSPVFKDNEQTFYIEKGRGFTAKEAYNLLSGRTVYKNLVSKEGTKYNAFVQLDFKGEKTEAGNYKFKSYHDNYGFNLSETLSQYPIKFDNISDRENLIKSLEKGNLQKVTLESGETLFAQTEPASRDIKFYNAELRQIDLRVDKSRGVEIKEVVFMGPESPEQNESEQKKSSIKR